MRPLSSNSRYKSKNDADEAVSVVSLTSSSGNDLYNNAPLCQFEIGEQNIYIIMFQAMQGLVAIILISWNVIFIWETGYWTRAMKRFALFDLLKSLYSDTKI
jgi:ABC-type proline/glycine betaine transport system permease subunit